MKTKRKLEDFGELSVAENKILAGIDSGDLIKIHVGLPPETGGDYDVRAEFIRYLALGGCEACRLHEKGLRIVGARINGTLDLEGGELPRDLGLVWCRFDSELIFRSTKLQNLFLTGSLLPKGMSADRLEAKGSANLRGVEAHGAVRLLGAKLGGDLSCEGAKFNAAKDDEGKPTGDAFAADGLEAKGSVFLQGVEARGEVRLLGAKLGGDLDCTGAKFNAAKDKGGIQKGDALSVERLEAKGFAFLCEIEAHGAVCLLGAKLGGSLECDGAKFNAAKDKDGHPIGYAFSAEELEAKGTVFLRSGATVDGPISLVGAQVGGLIDEEDCWPSDEGSINLNRFRYDAILGHAPVDAETRIKWLDKIYHTNGFSPQPYEQLAKVLREMGHRENAREVMIKKEKLQREARRKKAREDLLFEDAYWFSVWDRVMAWTVRYGYRPFGAVAWLAAFLLVGYFTFGVADGNGAFKPNDSRVWLSDVWEEAAGKEPSQVSYFLANGGESYPVFNPFIYSADVLLPIVDFDMQDAWIPDEDKAPWVRFYMWLHIALGWFFSLLAVAGFSGLIKPE